MVWVSLCLVSSYSRMSDRLNNSSRRGKNSLSKAAFALLILSSCAGLCEAQWDDYYSDGGEFTPEYRAATVVTNLWIGIFAVLSTVFGILGKGRRGSFMHS
jgi:hypothetical protein